MPFPSSSSSNTTSPMSASSSSSSYPSQQASSSAGTISKAAIAGIVIGAVVFTTLTICGLLYFFKLRRGQGRVANSNASHAGPRSNMSRGHRAVDSISSYSAGEAGKTDPYKAKALREDEYGYGYGFGYYGKSTDADDKSIAGTSVGGDTLVSNHEHELAHTASLPYAYPSRSPNSSSPTHFHSSPLSPTTYPPPPVDRQFSREVTDHDQQLSPSRKRTMRKPVPKYINDSSAPSTPASEIPPSPTHFYSEPQQRQVFPNEHLADHRISTNTSSSLAIAPDGTPVRININDLPQLSHKSSFGNGRQLHYFIPDMPPPQSR